MFTEICWSHISFFVCKILVAIIKFKNIKSNLQHVIYYGKNGDKTENGALVSSINCGVETAYEEMELTKKFYHKEDKSLGYHIIQSLMDLKHLLQMQIKLENN